MSASPWLRRLHRAARSSPRYRVIR